MKVLEVYGVGYDVNDEQATQPPDENVTPIE